MLSLRSIWGFVIFVMCLATSPAFSELGYLEYSVGVALIPDQNLTGSSSAGLQPLSGKIEPTAGYTVGGALGLRFSEMFRGELALDYRSAEIDGLAVQGSPSGARGEIALFSAMLNAYVDYDLKHDLKLTVVPYLGAGVGYGRLEVRGENRGTTLKISDAASVFVWNVMVGGTLPISDVADLKVGYRYVSTTDPKLDSRVSAIGVRRLDSEFDAHEVMLGVRFKF